MANTQWNSADKSTQITLTGSNLIATATALGTFSVRAVDKQIAGKFYYECTYNVTGGVNTGAGIVPGALAIPFPWTSVASTGACAVISNGSIYLNGTNTGTSLGTIAAGGVVGFAVDCSARLIWFRSGAAGNWNANAGASPATGVGGIAIPIGGAFPIYPAASLTNNGDQVTANFGDTAFVGAVPSGYTSGFTAGASVPTNAIASQALAEHWLTTNPQAQITQVVAEHWASVASGNLQAVVTQVLLEHWGSVAVVVPAAGGPMVTMIH